MVSTLVYNRREKSYADEHGNKVFIKHFRTKVRAKEALRSLKNCRDCVNCRDCENCNACTNCHDCTACDYCNDCAGISNGLLQTDKIRVDL